MNSQKLQDQYPKIYGDFFKSCQKVVSAPHSFFWTGDFSGFYGGLTISLKLPLRFYVGLEKIKADQFDLCQEFPAYFPETAKFSQIRLDHYLVENLREFIGEKLKGYRVHFLSELTLGLSLGGLGAVAACLAELIGSLEGSNSSRLTDLTKKFDLASSIALRLQRGRTSAATVFSSLVSSNYPTVFYCKGAKWWGKTLDEIVKLPESIAWPIDFGLIFSGKLVQGSAVILSAEEIKKTSRSREKRIREMIGSSPGTFWPVYISMLDQVANQNLLAQTDLFKKGSSETNLKFFFDTINQYQNILHFLEISTPAIDKIYSGVHKLANNLWDGIGSGCKISGVGKGGEVLFALPYGQHRERIEKFINDEKLSLDYASWRDGFEKRGVICEQDIFAKHYSPFVKGEMNILTVYKDNDIETKIIDRQQISSIKVDLLLDKNLNKVFCSGKKVTSTQLPSQKGVVEILGKILQSKTLKITNKQISSSYGKSRFDLQSKITSPLSKLCRLEFELTGKMYDNFSLRLKPFGISIAILEKIN